MQHCRLIIYYMILSTGLKNSPFNSIKTREYRISSYLFPHIHVTTFPPDLLRFKIICYLWQFSQSFHTKKWKHQQKIVFISSNSAILLSAICSRALRKNKNTFCGSWVVFSPCIRAPNCVVTDTIEQELSWISYEGMLLSKLKTSVERKLKRNSRGKWNS